MAKKRTISQQIGDLGEAIFNLFAQKNGLIPTKVTDYGFDFVCQTTSNDNDGLQVLSSGMIAVFVRSTSIEGSRNKITLSKSDMQNIINSDFPVLITAINTKSEMVYYLFFDIELFNLFRKSILDGKKSYTLTTTYYQNDKIDFASALSRATQPKVIHSIRVKRAEIKISALIGKSHLSIRQDSNGVFAIVEVTDIESTIGKMASMTGKDLRGLHLSSDYTTSFTKLIAISQKPLVKEINPLADRLAIITEIPESEKALLIASDKHNNIQECLFEVRKYNDEISFYHPAGLSLVISGARQDNDGLHRHHMDVLFEEDNEQNIFAFNDLVSFVRNCEADSTILIDANDRQGIPVKHWPELVNFNKSIELITEVYNELAIEQPFVSMSNIADETSFASMSIGTLAWLLKSERKQGVWPGFVLRDCGKDLTEVSCQILCPLLVFLQNKMSIVEIEFIGRALSCDTHHKTQVCGFQFDRYQSMRIGNLDDLTLTNLASISWPIIILNRYAGIELKNDGPNYIESPIAREIEYRILG